MQKLIADLQASNIGEIRTNERLAPYTTWKIGGPADLLIVPNGKEELVTAVQLLHKHGIAWTNLTQSLKFFDHLKLD